MAVSKLFPSAIQISGYVWGSDHFVIRCNSIPCNAFVYAHIHVMLYLSGPCLYIQHVWSITNPSQTVPLHATCLSTVTQDNARQLNHANLPPPITTNIMEELHCDFSADIFYLVAYFSYVICFIYPILQSLFVAS